MSAWPMFVRKLAVDFIETALGALLALTLVFPSDVASARQDALLVGIGIIGAAVSAVRREAPDFVAWLASRLAIPPNG